MKEFDRSKVVMNYYKASSALMEIGTTQNLPSELLELSLNASRATIKIIDYINAHRGEEIDESNSVN
jgi:hypothetical protein